MYVTVHVWKSTEEKAEMTDDLHNDLVYLDEYALGLAHEWGQSMATNSSVNVTEIENVHQVMKEQLFRISDLEGVLSVEGHCVLYCSHVTVCLLNVIFRFLHFQSVMYGICRCLPPSDPGECILPQQNTPVLFQCLANSVQDRESIPYRICCKCMVH